MSGTREEITLLLDSLDADEIEQVLSFVRRLLDESDDLIEKESRELELGEEEIRRGDWVRWEDAKRIDV